MENNKLNTIIDGRAIAADLFKNIAAHVAQLKFKPILCDVVVGDDPVSLSYVKIKGKRAVECGMEFSLVQLPESATEQEIIAVIEEQQRIVRMCGVIVQLPLPQPLRSSQILPAINSDVDVDNINMSGKTIFVPPTAGAIIHILESLPVDLQKEKFLVFGEGELVGKPIAKLLRERNCDVTTVNAHTPNTHELLQNATTIISGVGKAGFLTGEDIPENAIVIDAGTSESGGSIAGDIDFTSVAPTARFITPSPGGVGPVTVAKLLENVLIAAQNKA